MTEEDVVAEFRDAGALLEGHFVLTSGLHSPVYFNKSVVGMYPERVERLCTALADKLRAVLGSPPGYVLAPVMGAVVFGYETARQLGARSVFMERKEGGGFELRRGFTLSQGASVVVIEDVISTGLSAGEAVAAARDAGGDVQAIGCLVDRSGGEGGRERWRAARAFTDVERARL